MRRLLILVGVTVVVASTLTHAGAQRRTGDQAVRLARTAFEKSVEVRLADRRSKCLSAVGSPAFCDCLNGSLPLAVEFQRYIAVTTTSGADSGSVQAQPNDQKTADFILASRDQCVAKAFAAAK